MRGTRVVMVWLIVLFGAAMGAGTAGDVAGLSQFRALQTGGSSTVSGGGAPTLRWIPSGEFVMGDTFAEGHPDELPVHTVFVSAFWMGQTEVTNDEMVDALQCALRNGKVRMVGSSPRNTDGEPRDLLNMEESQCRIVWTGEGFALKSDKASGYPCVQVTWYGAVAYCNFRSEMDGLSPCYSFDDWSCDWDASGYRLPTEAEWEKAARGGARAQRFPWSDGNTIQHSRANYLSNDAYDFDTSLTRGLHPDYAEGDIPYTSPVGAFPSNGYDLHDMAGNSWEWVWDVYGAHYYSDSPAKDPRGPEAASGSYRVVRSGRWGYDASSCRVSGRRYAWPEGRKPVGFRIAQSAES